MFDFLFKKKQPDDPNDPNKPLHLRPNEMRLIPLKPDSIFQSEIVHKFERFNPETQELEADLPILNPKTDPWLPGIIASKNVKIDPAKLRENFLAHLNNPENSFLGHW